MSDYNFKHIEEKWQLYWEQNQTFKAQASSDKPKYYALDMFPYPSGAGLHVGHPLGYIASDIVSRYKRNKGFNVLHPMGFDAFGLPAEQYAIQTGQHPAITTEQNIARYTEQLKNIGFSYDWEREVRTSDPAYYKWTQWIFMQLFNSYYNYTADKAAPISELVQEFAQHGNSRVNAACDEETPAFSAREWNSMNEQQQAEMLLKYRLTYVAEAVVNWCPALGTVLANDEVVGGLSERGGYPVERKRMRQWMMRITAYAERLLQGLESIDWPEPVKEMQRNWIGKSVGAELSFPVEHSEKKIEVFTTRIDTIFGASFVVLAPEHELVTQLTTDAQRQEVEDYVAVAKNRSERERMTDVKTVSGVFTGAYAINPISNERVPIWIADYVLAGYGTGAVMAVPAHDARDYAFARHFNALGYDLPVKQVVAGGNVAEEAYAAKEGKIINSGFLNGLDVKDAIKAGIAKAEELGVGKGRTQYRMRDAVFSRQRYWGEPVPVYFKDGIPYLVDESELPLELPKIDAYLPTETGEPPLGRAVDWKYDGQYEYELSTMPGWAGSSWYWYRYMDPKNDEAFASPESINYWRNVDLYIGGSEHATGHLLYSRFWNKFLYDLDLVPEQEPFKKLINQGMIQGRSNFVYRLAVNSTIRDRSGNTKHFPLNEIPKIFISRIWKEKLDNNALEAKTLLISKLRDIEAKVKKNYPGKIGSLEYSAIIPMHVDVNLAENDILDIEAFKKWRPENAEAEFILEDDGKYHCGVEIEKMSKSKYNVVNPDDLVERMGADTLRLYEMFLGPLEQFKPWNTNGMDGVHKFLKKYWRLFQDDAGNFAVSEAEPTSAERKSLHKTIKKVAEDIERFSFNTSVSSFMICVNELTQLKSNKRAILEPLTIILSPYAPHITEEVWQQLGHNTSISQAAFPQWREEYLTENTFEYPVSVNGKMRAKMTFAVDAPRDEMEAAVKEDAQVLKFMEGKPAKKIIIVPNKIINVVI